MNNKSFISLVLLSIFLPRFIIANDNLYNLFTVSGRVLEKGSRNPLSDVMVILAPQKKASNTTEELCGDSIEVFTDSLGGFQFNNIDSSNLTLICRFMGYYEYKRDITVTKNINITAYIDVNEETMVDYEVVSYYKKEVNETTVRSISRDEVDIIPGINRDPVKSITVAPGVSRPSFGYNIYSIRGAGINDNQYLFNNISIPFLWHTIDNHSIFVTDIIDDVTLYPGGYSVTYGDVIGGVIEVNDRNLTDSSWHSRIDLSTSASSITVGVPINKKISIIGSLRYNYYSKFINSIIDDLGMDGYYLDGFGKLRIVQSNNNIIELSLFTTRDNSVIDNEMNFDRRMKIGVMSWDYGITDNVKNSFRYGFTSNSIINTFINEDEKDTSVEKNSSHEIVENLAVNLNDNVSFNSGVDIKVASKDVKELESNVIINNYLTGAVGGYFALKYSPLKNWNSSIGYRLDYYPELSYNGSLIPKFYDYSIDDKFNKSFEPSLRFSSDIMIRDKHIFKMSVGTYNRAPLAQDYNYVIPNGVGPEHGVHYTLGYSSHLNDNIDISADGYINYSWDKNIKMEEGFNLQKRMMGIELHGKYSHSKSFEGILSYSLSNSVFRNDSLNDWTLTDLDILHNFQIISSWKLRKGKRIGLRFQYTTGYPYTPTLGSEYYDLDEFTYMPNVGEVNSDRFSPYLGLDILFEKRITLRKSYLTLYLSCDRVLHFLQLVDKSDGTPIYNPVETSLYNYDYSKLEGIANLPEPKIGFKIEF